MAIAPVMRAFLLLLAAALATALENANVPGPDQAPTVPEHQPFHTVVTLRNPYDRAVRIERIDSTCTCTHLVSDRTMLLPHGTASVTVEVDNRNKSDLQHITASVFVTDPEFEPIDIQLYWRVMAAVTIDAIAIGTDPLNRPADKAWRDVVRYVAHERPDELNRLRKTIRLGSENPPAEGLKILGIEYPGTLWRFVPVDQGNGSWRITATAADPEAQVPEGTRDETITIRTNHPDKPVITLNLVTMLDRNTDSQTIDPLAPPF